MTIWHDAPPNDGASVNFQLMRTPPKGAMSFVILSGRHSGTLLHYWKGRSTPCNCTDCEACKNGHKPRWYGYVYGFSMKTRRIIIFEFPQRSAPIIQNRIDQYRTLRGHTLTAKRTGSRPNSPVYLEFSDTIIDDNHLPTPDDLEAVLERMWERRETKPLFKELAGQERFPFLGSETNTEPSTNGIHPR